MSSAPRVVDAPRSPPRTELPAHLAALFIALLLGLQPLTTDLYLPALPTLTRQLAAPMHLAQMTMAALMLSFGVAQLVWGPLADRFGRRPVLLIGLSLYLLASAGGVLAPNIETLIVARVVQGAAMAAAVVCARAMVRDLYEPHEGAHVMSRGLSGLGIIAIASPTLGGLVAHWLGWRGALAVVAIVGAITLWAVWRKLPETLAQRNPRATQLRALAPAWPQGWWMPWPKQNSQCPISIPHSDCTPASAKPPITTPPASVNSAPRPTAPAMPKRSSQRRHTTVPIR